MYVNVHGSLHRALGIPNQDACRELQNVGKTKKVRLVCDGCTNIDPKNPESFNLTHSEVGASLFCSLYETLADPFDEEKFPKNAEIIMEKMLELVDFNKENLDKKLDWLLHNYCFTILAVFETEENFVVYCLGDGVILLKNHFDVVTYYEKKTGNNPPYLVNNYLLDNKVSFEKFIFSKKDIKNVGIASDGILPVIRKETSSGEEMSRLEKLEVDNILSKEFSALGYNPVEELKSLINRNPNLFCDDTTIVW